MIGPADVGVFSAAIASPIHRTTMNKYQLALRARDRLREMDANQNVWAGRLYAELLTMEPDADDGFSPDGTLPQASTTVTEPNPTTRTAATSQGQLSGNPATTPATVSHGLSPEGTLPLASPEVSTGGDLAGTATPADTAAGDLAAEVPADPSGILIF